MKELFFFLFRFVGGRIFAPLLSPKGLGGGKERKACLQASCPLLTAARVVALSPRCHTDTTGMSYGAPQLGHCALCCFRALPEMAGDFRLLVHFAVDRNGM